MRDQPRQQVNEHLGLIVGRQGRDRLLDRNSNSRQTVDMPPLPLIAAERLKPGFRPSKPGEMQTIMVYATRSRESIPDRASASAKPSPSHASPSPKRRLPVRSAAVVRRCRSACQARNVRRQRPSGMPPRTAEPLLIRKGAWMREPTGHYLPLPGPRKFIGDLVHFARRIPSAPVARSIRHLGTCRGAGAASGAAVVVVHLHEGLRAGRRRKRAVAAIAAGISLAAALRAPLDELRDGDRTDVSRRRGGLRRDLPGTRAADV